MINMLVSRLVLQRHWARWCDALSGAIDILCFFPTSAKLHSGIPRAWTECPWEESALQAMKNIHTPTPQPAESTALSLIVYMYMVKGKIVGMILNNYLIFKALCEDKEPLALIVTGLDDISDQTA